jgi:hypothetical protein
MSFASWYSIKKRLPDCPVILEVKLSASMFGWANRANVRITRKSDALFKIRPTVMSVRDFVGDLAVSRAKSSDQTCFVDYAEGCGDFVVDEWIHRDEVPFQKALRRFGSYRDLTVNEVAILEFWDKCHQVYRTMGGQ